MFTPDAPAELWAGRARGVQSWGHHVARRERDPTLSLCFFTLTLATRRPPILLLPVCFPVNRRYPRRSPARLDAGELLPHMARVRTGVLAGELLPHMVGVRSGDAHRRAATTQGRSTIELECSPARCYPRTRHANHSWQGKAGR